MKKNKNFLKKLTAVALGFVMTLGVGAAGYASAASETRASDVTHTAEVTSFTSSSIPSGWALTGATFNSSYYKMSKGATVTVLASTLFKTGNVLSTDMTINIACGTFGNWSGDKKITFNYDFLDESGNSISNATFTTNGLNSTQGTYRGDKVLSKPTDPSAIYKLKITFSTFATGDTARFAGIKLTYTETAGVVPPSVDSYTIHFANGGGTGSMSDATCDITKAYTIPNCEFTKEGYDFVDWIGSDNVHYDVGSTLLADRFAKDAEFTLTANWAVSTSVKDKITSADLAATGTSYTNFSNVSKNTAVYAGNSAQNTSGSNKRIQIRSQSPSGIVSTTSGGKIKKVIFGDNSNFNGKTITVYGKNSSYKDGSDLYDSSKAGTSLGTISNDGTITVSGDYTYVGVKASGAAYLGSITFVWEPIVTHTVTISGGASSIYVGGATTFTASCDQTDCSEILWSSSNTSVATIDNGTVIGKKDGTTTITASCPEGGSDSKTLTVTANALVLSPSEIPDAQKGGSRTITASLSGVSDQTVTYEWSSNSDAVTVTGNTATAALAYNKGGNATITCNATVNGVTFTNTCSVTVLTQDPVVSFDNPPSTGYTGISYDFTALSANIENGEWSWKINGNDFSGEHLDDSDCSIISYTFTEAGSYTITATCTGDDDATATANTTIVITASSSMLTIDKNSIELQKGSKISITPTLVVTGSYADKTTITVTEEGGVTLDKSTTTSGSPVEVTAGSTGGVAKVIFSANGQDVECAIEIPSTTSDKIVSSDLTADSNTYSDFENVKKNIAIYAGSSNLPAENQIGLRSKNSDSGIITTTSGGIISKVTVTWNGTTNNRQLDVYGKNTAYESASDLFDSSKQGELIGTLNYKTVLEDETELSNNEIEIDGSYAYVGVRSRNSATTFSDITFVWVEPKAVESVTAGQDSISVAKGASSQLTWTVLPSDASNKAVEFSMNPVLTGVTISDAGLVSVDSTATVGNETTIKIASKENSSIFDTVDLTILPTYLDNNKVLGRTGFTKFTTEQTFASVRNSSNYIEAKYIDGSTKTSKGDNVSMWANTKCYVNNGTSEEPNWVEYNMSSAITNADNGKSFKFIYTEVVNNVTYTQESNPFEISVDNVTIKESITLYHSNNDAYAHSHDFTKDTEYSATGTVTWSVVNAYSKASITQSGVLTIDGAPTNIGASMQFIVRAVCGACTRECTVTLKCEPATSVSVDWPDTIAHEASGVFTATVETEYARQAVCWTSDNEALTITPQSNKLKASWSTIHLESDVDVNVTAFVDEDGDEKYTEGEAIATKTITIHAAEIPVTEVNITEEDIEIWQDDDDAVNKAQFTLHATVTEGASVQKALWSIVEGSDNVVVSSGSIYEGLSKSWKFTGNSGTATIRATSMNKENVQVYDELTVTVKQSVLTDISVDASASTVVKEFEKDHVITASDYSGLVVKATYQSGNESVVTPTSVSCDTSKVGTSEVIVSYTLNGVTKTKSYQVTIHAPSLNVVKKTVTESQTDPTAHDAEIAKGEKLLNGGASIPSIEVSDPGYVVTKLEFDCRYNKSIDPAVTITVTIGGTSIGSQSIGNNFEDTLTFINTANATGNIILSFTNHCSGSSKQGTFYWNSLTMYDSGETIRTTSYSNNKMSDAMYIFINEYSEDLSAGKWDTIFSSSEYAALSANDKALFKDGVVSGTDDSGTKTSSKEFADFITKYDEIVKQYGPDFNVLERSVSYNNYTVEIDDMEIGILQAGSEYTLPTPSVAEGNKAVYYTADNQIFEAGETINVYEDLALTKVEITDVEKVSVSYEANYKYTTDDNGAFSEVTQTSLRMYISLDADTYNFYVEHGYDFSIVIYNVAKGKSSKINSSSMSVKYDAEKDVYVFNVGFNIPKEQYSTYLDISLIASNGSVSDETIKVRVNYISAAESLYQAYLNGSVSLNSKQIAALKAILNIVD